MPDFRHCPVCGALLAAKEWEGLPRQVCSRGECGYVFYRNSKPTAGALVVREDGALLLAKRGIAPFEGYWDIPGGFLEEGEHPEAGAVREVCEETGIEVAIDRLLGLYMDAYQGVHTLNVYYVAHPVGGALWAASDATDAAWFTRSQLPPRDRIAFENGRQALDDWLATEPV